MARTGTWEWDLESDELIWSENMYRLLGVSAGEVTPSPQYRAIESRNLIGAEMAVREVGVSPRLG
jgi:hypothetical protein